MGARSGLSQNWVDNILYGIFWLWIKYRSVQIWVGNQSQYSIIVFSKMLGESAWKKQQSMLEQDANNLSILKKQISKQSQIDASVQLSINEKIQTLKQNATILAKKLENQKHKNIELETIISHLRNIIEKDKIQEASFRDSNSFESLSGLDNRYKKLQYDLGQLNGKTNRITENVDQKRIKINQNRTERVIDSGIFRNIQKELIQSQLKFKKLLIQKIKYQKEYEKLLNSYEGLKGQASTYVEQKQSSKIKSKSSNTSLIVDESKANAIKKFTNIQVSKESLNQKPRSMAQIEEQNQYEQQKQMIVIKKLLSQTRLQNCQQLLHSFFHIEEINQKYFNQMTVYTDQSNQIEKYLSDFKKQNGDNKLHFYETKKQPTKNQALRCQQARIKTIIASTSEQTKVELDQIINFIGEDNFKAFLKCFSLKEYSLENGQSNFDEMRDILQDLQSHMNEILSKQTNPHEQKNNGTSRSNQHQKLEELINRVRKSDENLKVMKKQEFQEQYHKIIKSTSKNVIPKHQQKKQSALGNRK